MTPSILPWLAGQYIPNVEARVEDSDLILAQTQPDVVFELPLDVAFTTQTGVVTRNISLTHRADTVNIGDLGTVTDVRVDPEHVFLLQRPLGEIVRFVLPVAAAPNAKLVELTGNFAGRPMLANRVGDAWVVEVPLSEGRYIWQWRIDSTTPNDEATFAAVMGPSDPNARAGVRWVKPVQRLTDAYPR
jgi:hypothetical protein